MKKLLLIFLISCSSFPEWQDEMGERITMFDSGGRSIGLASIVQYRLDDVLGRGVEITVFVQNISDGEHGLHIHEGGCESPDFVGAGSHFNPEKRQHGFLNPEGAHVGDMKNIVVKNGKGAAKIMIAPLLLAEIRGRSIIVHENSDDYKSDPSGNSGKRIACGVI